MFTRKSAQVQTRERPLTTRSAESRSRARVGRSQRRGWLRGLKKEWWVYQLVFYKIIERKETPDKHVRVIEGQNICFIEIIKVQEGYISLFMHSMGRNA
jgi:hypothetical protein